MDITAIANRQAGAMTLETDVCIAGDGPAGMIMGLFLAKHGMDVIVLEKRTDFHQKFQRNEGETSFTQLMQELQKLGELNENIQPAMRELLLFIEEENVHQLLTKPLYKQDGHMNRMVVMALYKQAETYPNLTLMSGASVKEVLYENEQIAGVFAQTNKPEAFFIRSKITIGTEGQRLNQMENEQLPCSGHLWISQEEQASLSDAM